MRPLIYLPVLMCSLFLIVSNAMGKSFNIPLIIEDNSGLDRKSSPARGGVPLPQGKLQPQDVSDLAVVDQKGRTVPAQLKPFVLWWGRDGSVKWLLVDLLADVPADGKAEYRLVSKKSSSEKKLRIKETEDSITVFTGPLKAVVSKTRGTVLEEVYNDINLDGSFDSSERIIHPDQLNGSVVESDSQEVVHGKSNEYNMWGHGSGRIGRESYKSVGQLQEHEYASGMQKPDKVVIEADGPVRTTIRIEGRHLPQQRGEGIRPEGMYYYTVRLHFYAGKSYINIQHSLDNQRQEYPLHIYRIKEARLQFALDGEGESSYVYGSENQDRVQGSLQEETISLLQDSANRERWDLYNRLKGKDKDEAKETKGYFHRAKKNLGPAAFRGYKLVEGRSWPTDGEVIDEGDQAPGWGGIYIGDQGLSLAMQRFWVECPKAMRLSSKRLEAVFLPGFSPEQFQIHSSARKSHELTLDFHSDLDELKQTHKTAEAFQYPLHLRTNSDWYAGSGAYPRHLGVQEFQNTDDEHWYPHFQWDSSIFTANWRTAGIKEQFNGGGMHSNYFSLFHEYLQGGGLEKWEKGKVHAKWASEWIPWLLDDYSFSAENPVPQHQIVGWGEKSLYTYPEATRIEGWVNPYTTNIPAFSSPDKFHLDGEHLVHMWPFEWYYLTGSPIARQGLMAIGNQAKYSTHRHFFGDVSEPPPSLDTLFYFDDQKHPERIPPYFYTRIYASHLLSTAWTYAATGDEDSLFYARWLARRILYLQRKNCGTLGGKKNWNSIPPWQEAEAAIAAYALYRETGDKALLDIMGSWLEWVWNEAYEPGKGMPHRFERGKESGKFEHHWYPGVAAPLSYAALGDSKGLQITEEWAESSMHDIHKGEFLGRSVGQSAAYVLTYLQEKKENMDPPSTITDLQADYVRNKGIVLKWTAPSGTGADGDSSAGYWIKYSDRPIVNHPDFPEELGEKVGFYHADNIKGNPSLSKAGTEEKYVVKDLAPHAAYGSEKSLGVRDLDPGKYYFVIKARDTSGNLSSMSNVVSITID
ncbi:MAG: hypothetical protein ACLFV2_02140 [Desulfurivibrionaceae bacterium]